MKKLLVLVLLAAAAVVLFKYLDARGGEEADRGRVADMLQAIRENDEQKALCLWAIGKNSADMATMQRYSNDYLRFVEETGMRNGSSWSILKIVPDPVEHATIFTITSEDGDSVTLRVRKYVPVEVVRDT